MLRSKFLVSLAVIVGIALSGEHASGIGHIDIKREMLGVSTFLLSVLTHELGHAITAKLLFDCPIKITIGTHDQYKEPWLKVGGIAFAGFNPYVGFAGLDKNIMQKKAKATSKNIFNAKKLAVLLAGPLAGMATCFLGSYCLKNFFTHDSEYLKYHQMFLACASAHAANLVPYSPPGSGTHTDGAQICDVLGIKVPDAIRSSLPLWCLSHYFIFLAMRKILTSSGFYDVYSGIKS